MNMQEEWKIENLTKWQQNSETKNLEWLFFPPFFLCGLLWTKCQSSCLWQSCHERQTMCNKFPGDLKWRMTLNIYKYIFIFYFFLIIPSEADESRAKLWKNMNGLKKWTHKQFTHNIFNIPNKIVLMCTVNSHLSNRIVLIGTVNSHLFTIINIGKRLIKYTGNLKA